MIDYTAASETYDDTRGYSDEVIDRFRATVSLAPSVSVLDFGCGTGNYLSRIHQRFGCQCYGVDPSEGMRNKALTKSDQLQIADGNHTAIPFPSQSFDFCYMTDVIHHVPDLAVMFRELLRVLKTGGHLCVVTESHAQIDGRFYNRYFPSLAANEKGRYPDILDISARAEEEGFGVCSMEVIPTLVRAISDHFLRNVAKKNWSMFRLLSEDEFLLGLAALSADAGRTFESPAAGYTLLWFRRSLEA